MARHLTVVDVRALCPEYSKVEEEMSDLDLQYMDAVEVSQLNNLNSYAMELGNKLEMLARRTRGEI
jgi:inhibitor of KinA sporulation pathway (predicted exonuclease)